ncbi:hypothetical protein [Streptomyces sp. NPDC052225]|uniref:hypothetical protein n=1 Tax=Streptomyces sp. NPDC052225 TaxID=3154949 RepID=UPI0034149694
MTAHVHGGPRTLLGPRAPLSRVLAFYEGLAHADPAASWQAFTTTWNWAAPLPAAEPDAGARQPSGVRPTPDGYRLSGRWHRPPSAARGNWHALRLADDLYVVPARLVEGASRPRTGTDRTAAVRLTDLHVPTGLVTRTTATPLRAEHAAFHWTAVAALALGAARHVADTSGTTEHAAVLHDARLGLAAALDETVTPSSSARLADSVRRVSDAAHHVVAAVYTDALILDEITEPTPTVRLLEACAPILQQCGTRLACCRPPIRSFGKAPHGDDRRISG